MVHSLFKKIIILVCLLLISTGVDARTKTKAEYIPVNTSKFNKNLSAEDNTVQKIADKLDDLSATVGSVPWGNIIGNIGDQTDLVIPDKLSELTDDIGVAADWDEIGDIPTASPSDGDVTHFSTAGQIYAYILAQNFLTGITGNETAFNTWDKDASDDFDGAFGSLTGVPSWLADGDDDTTYTAGTGISISGTVISSTVTDTNTNAITECEDNLFLDGDGSCVPMAVDTVLTEAQVDAYANNNGYATSTALTTGLAGQDECSEITGCPTTAEQNVNADWDASSGDAQILNKPTIKFTAKIGFEDPTLSDDINSFDHTTSAITITSIYCETDTGTVDLDINIDDGTTPTGINGSYITCTSTGVHDETLAGDTSYTVGDRLDLVIDSVASTPGEIKVIVHGTYN